MRGEVPNSGFRDGEPLGSDAAIDEDRIVGHDDQLDGITSYLRPALRGNRPPGMPLHVLSGAGRSLINGDATVEGTLDSAGAGRADAIISTADQDAMNLMLRPLARGFDGPGASVVQTAEDVFGRYEDRAA